MTTTSTTPGVAPRAGDLTLGPVPSVGPLDRRLASRGPRVLEPDRPEGRSPQPDLVDLRRAPRLLGLADLERQLRVPGRDRLRLLAAAALPAGGPPQPGRLPAPAAVHVRGAEVRWPELDGGQRGPAADPDVGVRVRVQRPDTPYWMFCLIAATAGLGGGNFASSMANINFFYPAAKKVPHSASTLRAATSGSRSSSSSCRSSSAGPGCSASSRRPRAVSTWSGRPATPVSRSSPPWRRTSSWTTWAPRSPRCASSCRWFASARPGSWRSCTSAPSARSSATPRRCRC